jgi:hypothetical protein
VKLLIETCYEEEKILSGYTKITKV